MCSQLASPRPGGNTVRLGVQGLVSTEPSPNNFLYLLNLKLMSSVVTSM